MKFTLTLGTIMILEVLGLIVTLSTNVSQLTCPVPDGDVLYFPPGCELNLEELGLTDEFWKVFISYDSSIGFPLNGNFGTHVEDVLLFGEDPWDEYVLYREVSPVFVSNLVVIAWLRGPVPIDSKSFSSLKKLYTKGP